MRSVIITLCLLTLFKLQIALASLQFIVLGDTGKDNNSQALVAKAISNHCQLEKCDFGMLAGDNVYQVGMAAPNDPIMDAVFKKHYSHLGISFFAALGNHDYGKYANDWIRGSFQIEYSRKNPEFILPDFFYYVEFQDLVLAVIDTSRLMWNKDIEEQTKMVQEAYTQSRGKWFIVLGHHPYLSNGRHGNAGNYERLPFPSFISGKYVKEFIEQNLCGKADLYISGHDHNLQVFDGKQKGCDSHFLVSGAGAGAEEVKDRNQTLFAKGDLGFASLQVDPESLKLRIINSENKTLFQTEFPSKK